MPAEHKRIRDCDCGEDWGLGTGPLKREPNHIERDENLKPSCLGGLVCQRKLLIAELVAGPSIEGEAVEACALCLGNVGFPLGQSLVRGESQLCVRLASYPSIWWPEGNSIPCSGQTPCVRRLQQQL